MYEEFNKQVGMRIRQTRELSSMTREKFSELYGVSDSFLADIERGKRVYRRRLYIKFVQKLKYLRIISFLEQKHLTTQQQSLKC